jgi:hypothetical protein
MSDCQRRFFITVLPYAIEAFITEDWHGWHETLDHLGFTKSKKMLEECRNNQPDEPNFIMSEFRPIKYLLDEMEIKNKIPFDFECGAFKKPFRSHLKL